MSKLGVTRILNKLVRELEGSSAAFRYRTDSTLVHELIMSANAVELEIYHILEKRGYEPLDTKELQLLVKQGAEFICTETYDKVYADLSKTDREGLVGTPINFSVIIKQKMRVWRYSKVGGSKYKKNLTYFSTVKEYYKPSVDKVMTRLNKFFKDDIKSGKVKKIENEGKGFLDLGHNENNTIADRQVAAANAFLYNSLRPNKATVTSKITTSQLMDLGLDISMIKRGSYQRDIVSISLESASRNRNSAEEHSIKKAMIKDIERALDRLKIIDIEGSDSRPKTERKKIIKAFAKGIKKGPGVKVKTEDTKLKISKKVSTKKTIKSKTSKGKTSSVNTSAAIAAALKLPKGGKKSTSNSILSLPALINAKLAGTVKKNMGKPGLVYRTGRFAESVQATSVIKTAKGYPSIGFTYQKSPYQVFEDGLGKAPWANGQRDPRKVIEVSIREIARSLIEGRFYTRRE